MDTPYITESNGAVTFKLQDGPIREVGVNGSQIDDVIARARAKIDGFNKVAGCRENSLVLTKLDEALHWLEHRKRERERHGVEGTSAI